MLDLGIRPLLFPSKMPWQLLWPAWRRSRKLSDVDRRSLWALANQEEYLVFSVLPIARVFPKVCPQQACQGCLAKEQV